MWISKQLFEELQIRNRHDAALVQSLQAEIAKLAIERAMLQSENVRHIADKDWFKHRLNQVEMERAQLIYAATGGRGAAPSEGMKVMAPQFAMGPPAGTVSETLNEQYNPFGSMGEDSNAPEDQIPAHMVEDLTHMPKFKG